MKKLSKYKLDKIAERLENTFNKATTEEIEDGLNWYIGANQTVLSLSETFNVSVPRVAGTLSALSPRNKWIRNITDTKTVLEAVSKGLGPNDVKVSTFHTNKFKAFEIAKWNKSIPYTARKTFSFCRNIALLDGKYVTIDIWHLRACFGKTIKDRLSDSNYNDIQRITIEKAAEVGMKGYEYQAIIWLVTQRLSQ